MSPVLQAVVWIAAIGVPAFAMYCNGVQSARREAEEQVLSQVAVAIQSPTTSRADIFSVLERNQRDVSQARYVRACARLGMRTDFKNGWKADWDGLFTGLMQRDQNERSRAAQVIAEECGLSPTTSLKSERKMLMMQTVTAATAAMVPATMHSQTLTD